MTKLLLLIGIMIATDVGHATCENLTTEDVMALYEVLSKDEEVIKAFRGGAHIDTGPVAFPIHTGRHLFVKDMTLKTPSDGLITINEEEFQLPNYRAPMNVDIPLGEALEAMDSQDMNSKFSEYLRSKGKTQKNIDVGQQDCKFIIYDSARKKAQLGAFVGRLFKFNNATANSLSIK